MAGEAKGLFVCASVCVHNYIWQNCFAFCPRDVSDLQSAKLFRCILLRGKPPRTGGCEQFHNLKQQMYMLWKRPCSWRMCCVFQKNRVLATSRNAGWHINLQFFYLWSALCQCGHERNTPIHMWMQFSFYMEYMHRSALKSKLENKFE